METKGEERTESKRTSKVERTYEYMEKLGDYVGKAKDTALFEKEK